MDGMDAVVDAPVEEIESGLEEVEEGVEQEAAEPVEETQEPVKDDPYTTKFAREMRAALKAWEQANPEQAKYAKQARDNHARLFALQQIEPKGIDGIRENYSLLQAIGGSEGLTGLQERIASQERVDTLLAAGDAKAFDELGPEIAGGLAKLAPAYLDRVAKENPQALESAILPYVVSTLASSQMVGDFNSSVDQLKWRLNGRPLEQLSDEEIRQVAATAINAITGVATGLNGLGSKAQEVRQPEPTNQLDTRAQELDQREQKHYWNTNINPQVTSHIDAKFEEFFKPYNMRLKLDAGAKADLKAAYIQAINKASTQDQAYMRQQAIYLKQKSPDAAAVVNFNKNAVNKYAKNAIDGLVKARYAPFLNGKPKPQQQVSPNGKPQAPVSPNVEIRTVKPPMNEIDHRNTPVEWLAQKKYRLYSGKVVQWRPS